MRYRNVKTGAIIEVSSKLGGNNWELISGGAPKEPAVIVPLPYVEDKEEVKPVKKATRKTSKKKTTK